MDTESLIASLAGRAAPVRPLWPPARRFGLWAGLTAGLAVAGVWLLGARPDLGARLGAPAFVAAAGAPAATALAAGFVALMLAVPGAGEGWRRWTPVALGLGWAALVIVPLAREPFVLALAVGGPWSACVLKVVAIGALPAIASCVLVRRGAPLRPRWAAGFAALAGMAAGAAAVPFACPNDLAAHVVLTHFLPVPLFALVSAAAGRRWLTWRPASAV